MLDKKCKGVDMVYLLCKCTLRRSHLYKREANAALFSHYAHQLVDRSSTAGGEKEVFFFFYSYLASRWKDIPPKRRQQQ